MGKKIAFIGSSGGNLYKQGGNDLPAMMKELCRQTKAADMEIVFVQYVLASGSLDNVGPDSPATLFTWNGISVTTIRCRLPCIGSTSILARTMILPRPVRYACSMPLVP